MIPSKLYDVLKWSALILLPATATLVSVLGVVWNWDLAIVNGVVTSITAFAVWLGAIIGIASATHKAEEK